jgi:tRNA pseudouridine55 synthase
VTEDQPARGLLVDKPAGVTSHDVVADVRRERGGKVGHAGTLDPFATGLLLVLLGRATRMQRYLLELPKTYVATARLGWRSSTGDPDGELEETGRIPERLELPTGQIDQRVPMTSAVKVDGERLYKKAHRGESIETPTRRITVHRADLLDSDSDRASFEIECSSGTYIRTLVESLEDAYCETLRRTAIGELQIPESGPEEISVERLMSFLPERELTEP